MILKNFFNHQKPIEKSEVKVNWEIRKEVRGGAQLSNMFKYYYLVHNQAQRKKVNGRGPNSRKWAFL